MIKSKVLYLNQFPSAKQIADYPIVIYDRNLYKNPKVRSWLKKFKWSYSLEAGEKLKQLKSFESHTLKLLKLVETVGIKNICFVGVGGGSVGDFVGFLASVFKRGVSLVHIPSTWLAAIDSSHGGKTALNLGNYKNQIGTFYPATQVILCRSLLMTQPPERTLEAMGEILKTALLAGGSLWNQMSKEKVFDSQKIWNYLPQMVAYKYKIVQKDPFDRSGLRAILNFGHTFGHTFELTHKLPHGVAVNLGLRIALELSVVENIMEAKQLKSIFETPLLKTYLASEKVVQDFLSNIYQVESLLRQDKKISKQNKINFIFLKSPGKPQVIEISLSKLINAIQKKY